MSPDQNIGSSPLARGLRAAGDRRLQRLGIIPARAGFTSRASSLPEPHRDHPRSRGVYAQWASTAMGPAGSSPLARGLRDAPLGGGEGAGIIPARAGFTHLRLRHAGQPGDHPRSRGVYKDTPLRKDTQMGSSPLARGLRGVQLDRKHVRRIIPAPAGFTPTGSRPSSPRRDHPRSRGVYSRGDLMSPGRLGSSPLARGLREGLHRGRGTARIIPARAGFTEVRARGQAVGGDHPRSRGVYRDASICSR